MLTRRLHLLGPFYGKAGAQIELSKIAFFNSDMVSDIVALAVLRKLAGGLRLRGFWTKATPIRFAACGVMSESGNSARSEERRVGKECRL